MSTPVPSALTISGLGLQIGGATILKDVELDVAAGSLVGVIGPNGAGKTTLFNVVSGLLKPTSGRVLMNGDDITRASVPARARAGLGRTFQTSSLFPRLSVLGERAARRAGLPRRRLLAAAVPPANGCRDRAGPVQARGRGARAQARHPGRRHLARRQAQARDRGAPGDEREHRPAGRADGRRRLRGCRRTRRQHPSRCSGRTAARC